jgi:hypothetical protein
LFCITIAFREEMGIKFWISWFYDLRYKELVILDFDHARSVNVSPLMLNTNVDHQEPSINFVLYEFVWVFWVTLLQKFEKPRNYEVHSLAIVAFSIEVSVCPEYIIKRVLTFLAVSHEQLILWVCSFQVNFEIII